MKAASTPRERAERCFAVARSTTFAGERDAAIARGTAIVERAGLRLDSFDIPGRATAEGEVRTEAGAFSGRQYTRDELRETMSRFHRHMAAGDFLRRAMADYEASLREMEQAVGARSGETAYEARRRNFEEAAAAARERDAARDGRS